RPPVPPSRETNRLKGRRWEAERLKRSDCARFQAGKSAPTCRAAPKHTMSPVCPGGKECVRFSFTLPGQAQSELKDSRIVGARCAHEICTGDAGTGSLQIHAIERIECLESKRRPESFRDRKRLEETTIERS